MNELFCENHNQKIKYVETLKVKAGVVCDVYSFIKDKSKDLGIINIDPGFSTPLQKVLKGDKTIEGYISGKGQLTVTKKDGTKIQYKTKPGLEVKVSIGDLMQWGADAGAPLKVYEICYPPYTDGRYQNLD